VTLAWIEAMRGAPALAVAQRLGLPTAPPRGSNGGVIYTCPICHATRARPGSQHVYSGGKGVGVLRSGRGWRCYACDASGDALALACAVLGGRTRWKELDRTAQASVRAWCEGYAAGSDVARSATVPGATRPGAATVPGAARPSAATQEPPSFELTSPTNRDAARYPPIEEVDALFTQGWARLDSEPATQRWCASRGCDASRLDELGAACGLRPNFDGPDWARFGKRSWWNAGYRVVLPLFDVHGKLRSALARSILTKERLRDLPKSVAARDYERRGLLMMSRFARRVMREGTHPATWHDDDDDASAPFAVPRAWWDPACPLRVIVAEGESDYLRVSLAEDCDPGVGSIGATLHAPCILGMVQGAWSRDLAERIPAAPSGAAVTQVLILQDRDRAGEKYARAIHDSIKSRTARGEIKLQKWKPQTPAGET